MNDGKAIQAVQVVMTILGLVEGTRLIRNQKRREANETRGTREGKLSPLLDD